MRPTQCVVFFRLVLLAVVVPYAAAAEGPIASWPLDKDTRDTVGGIKLTAAQRPRFAERAMVFDGKGQFLSAEDPKAMDMGMSDFALEVVFKLDRYPKNHAFFVAKGNKGVGGYYYLACDNDNIRARIYDDDDPAHQGNVTISFAPVELGEWYHVIASFDRDAKLVVYVNGTSAGWADISEVGNIDNTDQFKIGMLWSQTFPGKIADVRIYRQAFSRADAQELFEAAQERRAHDFADMEIPDTTYVSWEKLRPEEADKATGVTKGNLLADSSFEGLVGVESLLNGPRWWAASGPVLREGGRHGPSCVKGHARTDPIPYAPSVPHTLSFYAKGPEGGPLNVVVRHSHKLTPPQKARKIKIPQLQFEAKLTGQWKRHSFAFMPGASVLFRNQNLVLRVQGKDALFDAFQLEQGGLTEYAPQPLEFFVNFKDSDGRYWVNYCFDDKPIPVTVVATRRGPAEISATLTVRDFWMRPAHTQKLKFSIADGAVAADMPVEIPHLPKGSYRVYLEGGGAKARSMILSVIGRDLREPAEIMGASHMAGLDWNARFTDAFGITWSRHHAGYTGPHGSRTAQIPWLGKDYWASEDKQLAQKSKNPKLRFWGSFYYPPAPWGRREGEEFKGLYMREYLKAGKLLPQDFYAKNEEYFRAAVPRFKEKIKYWECWNEPSNWNFTPKAYFEMLKWFHKVIKECDPEAVVVGFADFFHPTRWDKFTAPLLEMGALEYCDAFSFHGYFYDWAEDKLWETRELREYLDIIRGYAAKAGKPEMPIWDNEFTLWGESCYDNERPVAVAVSRRGVRRRHDGRAGVSRIVHYVTIGYAHGMRHFGPHMLTFRDPEQDQHRIEYTQPAMDYDGSVKPKGLAFAVVCHKMNGAKLVAERIDGDLFVYAFSKPAGSLAVVFTRHGKPAKLEMPEAKGLDLRNAFDGPFKGVASAGGKTTLSLKDNDPVYVQSSCSAEELARVLKGLRPASQR